MAAASPAFVPTFITFDADDDEDDFGEFEFVTSVQASSFPPPHLAVSDQQQRQQAAEEEDDDWGDFVESPLQPSRSPQPSPPPPPAGSSASSTQSSSFFDPFPGPRAGSPDPTPVSPAPLVSADKGWQKPSGALPLSLFGGDDEEEGEGEQFPSSVGPLVPAFNGGLFASSSTSPGSNGPVSAQSGGLKDLIASLYGQADKIGPATIAGGDDSSCDDTNINIANGANSDFSNGGDSGDGEFDESSWEFKDALSSAGAGDSGDPALVKEGQLTDTCGVDAKVTGGGSRFQTSDNFILKANGLEYDNTPGASLSSRDLTDDQDWESAFGSHDTVANGFDLGSSDNGCNGCISNVCHDVDHSNFENGLNHNVAFGDGLDDSFWEFKDASSNIEVLNCFSEPESIGTMNQNQLGNFHVPTCSSEDQDSVDPFKTIEAYAHGPIDNRKEDFEAGRVVGLNDLLSNMYNTCNATYSEQKSVISSVVCENPKDADGIHLQSDVFGSDRIKEKELSQNVDNICMEPTVVVDFYSRLKEKSCAMALNHINNLKLEKGDDKEIPDEEFKAEDVDGEIKAALVKLGIEDLKSDCKEKYPPNEFSVHELLEVIQEQGFLGTFDMEYCLSEKIPLAEKDLSSAVWLFEHASSVLHVLTLASFEDQQAYVISWSKMVSACLVELQHGALIWSQAFHANIQTDLLSESQGQQYFLALGEIYRVVEILCASIRLYKPWVLISLPESRDLLTHMGKSVKTWIDSGLKQALEIISDRFVELRLVTEELLESMKFISKLSTHTLQDHLCNNEVKFCKLSLLPLEVLRDMKQVVWHGDHYFCKLANLWANKISSYAPQLPHIHCG